MEITMQDVLCQFRINYNPQKYGNGHINDTYIIDSTPKYILQKINTNIFKNPDEVMENISRVTDFLRNKIKESGGNPDRETLTLIKTIAGSNFYRAENGDCFRMYKFIENCVSYDTADSVKLYNAAKAFGKFQNMLSDFPASELHETIPRFHDTYKRFCDFKASLDRDIKGRAKSASEEIGFALKFEEDSKVIKDCLDSGKIPYRVTHNDTKLNNVMLDKDTDEGICVIDLDTVMPGSLLYDYGDALRFGASTAAEDEQDLSKVHFDLELFKAFTKGFLETVSNAITPEEIRLLPFSAKIITYECGIRFLTDYLDGDTYFKTSMENHNLYRARTQFKLVREITDKTQEMEKIIKDLL